MKKNIWLISKYASPPSYGVGAKLFYLANELTKYNYNVTLIGSNSNHLAKYPETKEKYNYQKINDINYIWINTLQYDRSSSAKRMLTWLDFDRKLKKIHKIIDHKPDYVVISSLALTTIRYGIYLKKKFKCKLIFDIRDIYPLTLTEELGFNKRHPLVLYFGRLEKKGYKSADLITGTMPNLVSHVKEITKKDLNVFHSPLGIPQVWSESNTHISDLSINFPKNKFIVGYAGSMGKSNALDCFIETIKVMSKIDKDVYFILVGDGDMKSSFKNELKSFNNVSFEEKIPQKYVPDFLSKCDLLYLSTHDSKVWKYGQSMNKIIDYMMSEKPVIATYSGYPSMINEAKSGYFISEAKSEPIVEKILYFKNLEEKDRDLYGKRGKEWVSTNHSYEKIGRDFANELSKLE